jgi:hypothetical protein
MILGRFLPYILAGIGAVTVVTVIYFYGYNQGGTAVKAKYEEAMHKETLRLQRVNQESLAAAKIQVEHLQRVIGDRDAKIRELGKEAASDPDANRPAINADSVSRLNSIE